MKVAFANGIQALECVGCDAAGYRLSGEGLDKLCVIHLWGRWRLVLTFPEANVAVVVDVGDTSTTTGPAMSTRRQGLPL